MLRRMAGPGQIFAGLHAVQIHQALKGRTMRAEIALLDLVGFGDFDLEEGARLLADALRRACARQAEGPDAGLLLSGGLDSRLVLAASPRGALSCWTTASYHANPELAVARDTADLFGAVESRSTIPLHAMNPFERASADYAGTSLTTGPHPMALFREKAPHLWGGFAQYVYLPWNAVVHHVPKGVSPELAGLVTPMANGVEWALFDGNVGYNSTVLIQGPGQQGLSQTVICKQAGAALIIVTGTTKDAARLKVAKELGADYVIDVQKEDPLARIMEITGGKGVDVSLDCTAGAGAIPILLGIEALKRKGGIIVAQGEMSQFPNFPLEKFTVKFITMKSARGHSYRACELALEQIASKRFPLEKITTHRFGLNDVDLAIRSVGGKGVPDVIHASLMPWE